MYSIEKLLTEVHCLIVASRWKLKHDSQCSHNLYISEYLLRLLPFTEFMLYFIVNYAEDGTSPLLVITQQTPRHIVTGSALIFQSLAMFTSKIIS